MASSASQPSAITDGCRGPSGSDPAPCQPPAPVPPASQPTDSSLFPTGQEVQLPLFEREASGLPEKEDTVREQDEQYVVTFDGLRHHVRRRSDWQIVAGDLSEEEAINERIRRQYGGWAHYPPTRRTERSERKEAHRQPPQPKGSSV